MEVPTLGICSINADVLETAVSADQVWYPYDRIERRRRGGEISERERDEQVQGMNVVDRDGMDGQIDEV